MEGFLDIGVGVKLKVVVREIGKAYTAGLIGVAVEGNLLTILPLKGRL